MGSLGCRFPWEGGPWQVKFKTPVLLWRYLEPNWCLNHSFLHIGVCRSGGVQVLQPSVGAEQGERAAFRSAPVAAAHGTGGSDRTRDPGRSVPGYQVKHNSVQHKSITVNTHKDLNFETTIVPLIDIYCLGLYLSLSVARVWIPCIRGSLNSTTCWSWSWQKVIVATYSLGFMHTLNTF